MSRVALVTGGAGFVGSHVVERLLAAGETVRVLDLEPPQGAAAQAEHIAASVCDARTVAEAAQGADAIFHLAANAHLWAPRRETFEAVNVGGAMNVIAAARQAGGPRIVHVSSLTTLIGKARTRAVRTADEGVRLPASDMLGPYPMSKHRAEAAMLAAAEGGADVVVAIPTLPLGPGDRRLTGPTKMLLDFLNGDTPASVECTLNFIDVGALADALIAARDRGRTGERYLLAGHNMWMSDFLQRVSEVTGAPTPRAQVPYAAALAAGLIDDWIATHVRRAPPTAPATGVRISGRKVFFENAKAKRELGLKVPDFAETLRSAAAWLAQTGLWRRSGT